ncbi:MAG: glycosyltransferase family 8 protein [Clostridia bacterium]|nr:glycosyltransferase family 8 protein [Clostridia bacterium]
MNILFCGDRNISDGVLITTLSLLKNTNEDLNIFILTASFDHGGKRYEGVSPEFARFLLERVRKENAGNSVRLFDVSPLFEAELPKANMATRFTPCCMLRLYADLVPELPDRLLYLDNDVVCRSDPSEFYSQDIEDCELAGVLDYYGSWFFKSKPLKIGRDYLNSGVLLLNMKKIRETGLFKSCRARCRSVEMFMPDQSAINKLARFKKICPRRFNEQRHMQKDTVFRHFTTTFRFFPKFRAVTVKPWDIDRVHSVLSIFEFDGLLEEFKRLKRSNRPVEENR